MIKRFGYFKGESIEYKNIKVLGKVGNKTNFTCDCPKCGGKGKIDIFNYIDDGICFKCSGSGRIEETKILYSEEEVNEKIRVYREKKDKNFAMEIAKANQEDQIANGFKNGYVYAVCGNCYSIKEELKEAGARWNRELRAWTFEEDNENYKTRKVTYEEITSADEVYKGSGIIRVLIDVPKLLDIRELLK